MNKSFTFRSVLAVVAMAGVVQGTASAACWYPDEIVADQVKDFQYMLMVGALQCRNTVGPGNEAYNAFIAHQRGVLDSKGYVLKGHFLRENGLEGGRDAYDRNNTAMSNRHAGRFDDPSFCQTIAAYTRIAATASDRDFVVLAQSVIEAPASSCGTVAYAVAPPPPVARRPEPQPMIEAPLAAADPYAGEAVAERADYREPQPYPAAGYRPYPRGADRDEAPFAVAAPADLPVAPPALVPVAPPPVAAAPPPAPVAVAYAPSPVAAPAVAYEPAPAAPPVAYAAPVAAPQRVAAAMPTRVIAVAPVVPPEEARPSPAAALQAAIAALQAATDALRAQAGPTN